MSDFRLGDLIQAIDENKEAMNVQLTGSNVVKEIEGLKDIEVDPGESIETNLSNVNGKTLNLTLTQQQGQDTPYKVVFEFKDYTGNTVLWKRVYPVNHSTEPGGQFTHALFSVQKPTNADDFKIVITNKSDKDDLEFRRASLESSFFLDVEKVNYAKEYLFHKSNQDGETNFFSEIYYYLADCKRASLVIHNNTDQNLALYIETQPMPGFGFTPTGLRTIVQGDNFDDRAISLGRINENYPISSGRNYVILPQDNISSYDISEQKSLITMLNYNHQGEIRFRFYAENEITEGEITVFLNKELI